MAAVSDVHGVHLSVQAWAGFFNVSHPDVFLNIYKVQIFFSVKHIQFSVKNTFKATCFGSTEPSSGLFLRTDPYLIASTFGIPDVLVIRYKSILIKRPDDGSVESKHVVLNVFLKIKIGCV